MNGKAAAEHPWWSGAPDRAGLGRLGPRRYGCPATPSATRSMTEFSYRAPIKPMPGDKGDPANFRILVSMPVRSIITNPIPC
jgi:sulfite oxidase